MKIVFIAPPAAGKGVQASMLEKNLGMYHLSTGDLLREIASSDTDLGLEVKGLIDNGLFVSDELMLKLLKEKINSLDVNGIIFDGFPRTLKQADMLSELLKERNENIDYVISLDVTKDIACKRATGRITCPKCGNIYNIYFDKFNEPGKCNSCGNILVKREDDTEEKFNKRFDTYVNNTKPLLDYYKDKNMLYVVSSVGDKEIIHKNILSIIKNEV